MPFVRMLPVLLFGLLLSGSAAWAQQTGRPKPADAKPAPPPRREQRVFTVHLPLTPLIARLGETVGLLERSGGKNRRAEADEPRPDDSVLVLTLPLPKLFDTKPAAAPAHATP